MITGTRIRTAGESDFAGLLELAAEVEHWFGPMVAEPGFHRALRTHLGRSTALVAETADGALVGGLLFAPAADSPGPGPAPGPGSAPVPGPAAVPGPDGARGPAVPVDRPSPDRESAEGPVHHVDWLVISERARGTGVGRALLARALERFAPAPATVEVITFGADHPGAVTSGARVFYERLGFTPGPAADPGPEGGSRQLYRLRRTG
ncbi:GNAT family N-acetyltransferase [Streptomyces clavuligerus]|uniref:Putative acetyltransferase n=7 Tax=Streptomyces clavuligerus TaxID=1901 RepID=E2Q3P6_STRCL|nr:GNAT family N-acetyltransferase [Streptomyces clavuligerus]ANW20213.1 acetyltransferase [Streptomyces clavuligerus]AXU14837.1 N-acetyltransferase [Streptomyces clavuligerus]EFG06866.1 putative acetyltransferase [Streptomyces clavuligerus]MBY6304874.1 GNAT family N-acetyltransferase [Streptomyces clavuligerus]QCS07609.1 N-acetyltransferase [Streptomyces clavuligerus]